MKINTLEHIHRVLMSERERTQKEYRVSRDLQIKYEEAENPVKELIKMQTEEANALWDKYCKASAALEDFEAKEW